MDSADPLPKSYWLALGSLVPMVLGAFGPWVTVLQTVTFSGTDDNAGKTVVGCAAAAGLILALLARVRNRWLCIVPFLAAALGTWVAGYNIHDIRSAGDPGLESTEWGIWVALAGSIGLGLASIVLGVQTKPDRRDERIPIPGSTGKAKARNPWGVFVLAIVTFGGY